MPRSRKFVIVFIILLFNLNIDAQCLVQGFPSSMPTNSTATFQIGPNLTEVSVHNYSSYPSNPGIDKDSNPSAGVAGVQFFQGSTVGYVHSGNTSGTYFIRIRTSNCDETISLDVSSLTPVTWISAPKAEKVNNHVAILWSVAQQVNNALFEIEHSMDGKAFQKIGELQGHGTYAEPKEYRHIHEAPAQGINYYRIKQVDYDGQFDYSEVSQVAFSADYKFTIFPNPTFDHIRIHLDSDSNFSIYDSTGKGVLSRLLIRGNSEISLTYLPHGIYFGKIDNGTPQKIIKW